MQLRKTYIAGIIFLVVVLLGAWYSYVHAEVVTIDSSPDTTTSNTGHGRNVVFVSATTGYVFYVDASDTCKYSKTTNRGLTWGAAVTVDSQTDCTHLNVWYDRWTPGDTTGTYIHVATADSGNDDVWYTRLDTSSDTLTTTVNATGANQGGSFATDIGLLTITKGTDGTLYMGTSDNSDSFIIECSATCTSAGNWTETGTNPLDVADSDTQMLVPLASGDILLVNHDISGDVLRSKVWNNSSWSVSWTNIATSVDDNGAGVPVFSIVADPNNAGTVYLAYLDDVSSYNTDEDVKTAVYSGSSWTSKTDIITNGGGSYGIQGVSIGLSGGKVYVVYGHTHRVTSIATDIYWKYSSDGMTTWSSESVLVGNLVGDYYNRFPVLDAAPAAGLLYVQYSYSNGPQIKGAQIAANFPTDDASYIKFTGNVKFLRNIAVVSSLSKSTGTFVIDHPQKPRTHLLYHSFVESPDVKNLYDGIATLDEKGEVTIELPDYFEALNKDFRYQFFPLDGAMPDLHIKEKVKDNKFTIAGGTAGEKISWQITGIRHDPYILANPIKVEVDKGLKELVDKGECIFEPLCQ